MGDAFFEAFEYSIVEKGALRIELDLLRTEGLLDLHFRIYGTIELVCDRSLELFDHPLDLREEMVLKFGDKAGEVDDELEMIPWDLDLLNIAGYLYEMITVAVPLKRLHPRYQDQQDDSDEIVYSSGREEGESGDPRWEALRKLKSKMK